MMRCAALIVAASPRLASAQGTDVSFLSKICTAFKATPAFVYSRLRPAEFAIRHFAGQVTYTAGGW